MLTWLAWQCCAKSALHATEAPTPTPRVSGLSHSPTIFSRPREVTLSRTLQSTPELRVLHALAEARKARHHKDCRCRMFDRQFCNAADALWQNRMNRFLDECRANHG